jgi:NTP pyrophosphatase (non-canonical NTP hydrolase)
MEVTIMPTLKPSPTLADIQRYVVELEHERGFTDFTVLQECLLLGEEVGELFKAVRKSEAQMGYASEGYDANPAHEIADIVIMLCAVANRLGVDIEKAFRDKEVLNHKRVWR